MKNNSFSSDLNSETIFFKSSEHRLEVLALIEKFGYLVIEQSEEKITYSLIPPKKE